MRGPPLGPLLPLLLILNTASVNPESTTSPSRATTSSIKVKPQQEVADKDSSKISTTTDISIDMISTIGNGLLRPIRSDSGSSPTRDPFVYEYSSNKTMKILSQIYESVGNSSQSPLAVDNLVLNRNDTQMSSLGSVDVVVPSLVGNIDLKGVENKFNITGSVFLANNPRNRSSYIQRLGRTDAPMLNYIFDTYSTLNKHHHRNDRFGGPRIETSGVKLEVDTDAEAQLDCRVTSLQDKLVSWVRRRPEDDSLELLTIGQQTYTADFRFVVDFRQPDNWRLVLNSAKPADSGIYECQISTHPPLISKLELVVNAPVVSIVEAGGRELRDKYYERNSTLKLACRIRHLAAQTPAVFWLHSDRILNDDTLRGGVSVRTEAVEGGADSTLLVARLNSSDSGRYTCSVGTDLFAVVNVHVLNGESLAELHQGSSSRTECPSIVLLLLTSMMVICVTEVILGTLFHRMNPHSRIAEDQISKNIRTH